MVQKSELVPPDGGWGWVIVFAMGLNNVIFIPIMQCFGLIFKDQFQIMGFSATDGSIIITMNAACSMMSGLINGPLLRQFGYRKIAVVAAIFTFLGIVFTAYANSFTSLLIAYGFITSLGMGMGMSAYPLAFNSYFKKLRNKAMGITMTITGLGPIFMPQLISLLLYEFGVRWSVLILAGISANTFTSAFLLQPVKWHMKKAEKGAEEGTDDKIAIDSKETEDALINKEALDDENSNVVKKTDSALSINYDLEVRAIYGFDTPLAGSVLSLNSGSRPRRMSSSSYKSAHDKHFKPNWPSAYSINMSPYSSLANIPEVTKADRETLKEPEKNGALLAPVQNNVYNDLSVKKVKESSLKRALKVIVNFFDLTLLKDPIYVNIMMGMSLAIFAELTFSLLTPFILDDFGLETAQIANFLTVLSITDICFRFLAPFIGDYLKQSARIMYSFSLILLIITRYALLVFSGYDNLLVVSAALGVAKGVRTVYMSLVIPCYVPIERLAAASGLQMMVNGILVLFGGPLLGMIRDATGSYTNCIFIINSVTLATLVMWSLEGLYQKYRKTKIKDSALENL